MALFTDGPISSVEDLTAQDSQLPDVASTEGIDVTQKIALAQSEMAIDLEMLAARRLGAVVVTPALKLWHTFRALEMFYTDAYNSQLNDRYAGKQKQFAELARWAKDRTMAAGVGIAADPVARAKTPQVAAAAGDLETGTYYATMAWVNRHGEEGASAVAAVVSIVQSKLEVTPGAAPANAAGWNVYVGTSPEAMTRQNTAALAAGQAWVQTAALTSTGPEPGTGQEPSYLKAVARVLQRG
jgi:hypothetical protein